MSQREQLYPARAMHSGNMGQSNANVGNRQSTTGLSSSEPNSSHCRQTQQLPEGAEQSAVSLSPLVLVDGKGEEDVPDAAAIHLVACRQQPPQSAVHDEDDHSESGLGLWQRLPRGGVLHSVVPFTPSQGRHRRGGS